MLYVNQWLQTLCSFPMRLMHYFAYKSEITNPTFVSMRFLQYFVYKSKVTNPMFVLNVISAVFRILSAQMAFIRQGSRYEHRIAFH